MPDKKYTTEPVSKSISVIFKNETIVESDQAVVLHEGCHQPVYYFPRSDAKMKFLNPTDHLTHWAHKGDASYFSITVGDQSAENAVWSYETPIDSAKEIKNLLAFYANQVEFVEK